MLMTASDSTFEGTLAWPIQSPRTALIAHKPYLLAATSIKTCCWLSTSIFASVVGRFLGLLLYKNHQVPCNSK
jgi:hypothetical protein